jgi:hypothetical protein
MSTGSRVLCVELEVAGEKEVDAAIAAARAAFEGPWSEFTVVYIPLIYQSGSTSSSLHILIPCCVPLETSQFKCPMNL